MTMTFNTWYLAIICGSGLAFMVLAVIGYVTGLTYLLSIGVAFFAGATMIMTTFYAGRQHDARAKVIK
ncbi:hypothetical protein [Glutamicibacter sp. JC586]|uniref:hypothetical protein n=1 Tax=Glutamicibacter sp. JC586 TaxID=2590552 RepID=UPI001359FC90|nr:hypothetical protein [Glutamicibacter sp. JC586]